jgi:hypothetical protein
MQSRSWLQRYWGPLLLAAISLIGCGWYATTFNWSEMHVGDRIAFDGFLLALGTLLIATFQWALMIRQDEFMSRRAVLDIDFINGHFEHSEPVAADSTVTLPMQIHNRGEKTTTPFYVNLGVPVGGPAVGPPFEAQGFSYLFNGTTYDLYSFILPEPVFPGARINFAVKFMNPIADGVRRHFGWQISSEDGRFPGPDKFSLLHYRVTNHPGSENY